MFVDLYQKARNTAFTPANIEGAWRGAGLVPLNPGRAVEYALPSLRTPSPPPTSIHTPASPPATPSSSAGVQRLRKQLLSREARLSPYARIGIQKVCNTAQKAMTEAAILRYDNKQLRYRLQQKDARNSQKRFIVSRVRVVLERDIQEAKLTKSPVRQLQLEWPGWPPRAA
jgi:regulator of replication initiation timing